MFQSLIQYAQNHNVNPTIFLIIYVASIPFFYYPLFRIKKFYEERKDKNKLSRDVFTSIMINGLAWAAPYLYVIIWGKSLPLWIYLVVIGYLVLGFSYSIYRIRKRSQD
jgi:uncharacterized membrane protein